jgi:hypothetical protein
VDVDDADDRDGATGCRVWIVLLSSTVLPLFSLIGSSGRNSRSDLTVSARTPFHNFILLGNIIFIFAFSDGS